MPQFLLFARNNLLKIDFMSFRFAALTALLFFSLLLLVNPSLPWSSDVPQAQGAIVNSYMAKADKNYTAELSFVVDYKPGQNTVIEIVANSCIKSITTVKYDPINYELIQKPVYEADECEKSSEIKYDLAPHLVEGSNEFILKLANVRYDYTLHTYSTSVHISMALFGAHFLSSIACIGCLASVALGIYLLGKRCQMTRGSCFILVAGFIYFSLWLWLTKHSRYTNDLPIHMYYINYIGSHWSIPPNEGTVTSHPPLYYLLSTILCKIIGSISPLHGLLVIRLFSLFLFMTYCFFGLLLMHYMRPERSMAFYMGQVLLVFWPLNILLATRINNDIAVYALWSVALYCITRWYYEKKPIQLQLAIILTGICFLVKSNACIILAIVGMYVLWALVKKRLHIRELLHVRYGIAIILFCACLSINFQRPTTYLKDIKSVAVVQNDFVGEVIREKIHNSGKENNVNNFTRFSLHELLKDPYASIYHNYSYTSYLFKSSLYGEFQWDHRKLAIAINTTLFLWLSLYAGSLGAVLYKTPSLVHKLLPIGFAVLLPILASIGFSYIYYVLVTTEDFRYIVPILIPLMIGFSAIMSKLRGKRYWIILYAMLFCVSVALVTLPMVLYVLCRL